MKLKLTETLSIQVNTSMEKHVLMMLLYYNKFSSVKIDNTAIYLHSNSDGDPEVIYGNTFKTVKAKVSIINNAGIFEEWLDVSNITQQLTDAVLSDTEDGKFSYIDWEKQYITVSTNLSEVNSGIRFKLNDIPSLKSENIEICNAMNPKVENIGLEGGKFQAFITSRIIKAKLSVDINNPLDTFVVEV